MVHQAYIDVDETGTEAAAATGVIIRTAAIAMPIFPPIEFNADHPFEFLIVDNQSGTILFEGNVMNPDPTAAQTSPAPGSTPPALWNAVPLPTTPGTTPTPPPVVPVPVATPPQWITGTVITITQIAPAHR